MVQPPLLNRNGLLSPIQLSFLTLFAEIPDQDQFFLTGGTALAEFYLGHRLSYDLDLFTATEALINPISYQVEHMGRDHGYEIKVVRRFTTYTELLITQGVEQLKIDFALDSPFRFEPPIQSDIGIFVNSRKDIQTDKLLAYYGRAEPRDAVDLYFILAEVAIKDLLLLASQKDSGFDRYWFSVALNRSADFPNEIERWPVNMILPFDPQKLKADFRALSLHLMDQLTE